MKLPTLLAFAATLLLAAHSPAAVEPRILEKAEAEKILLGMDYDRVAVVAIVEGVHQKGNTSLNCAVVIGLGRRNAKDVEIAQSFFFDRELGWFYYELVPGKMRIWNQLGYSEAKL